MRRSKTEVLFIIIFILLSIGLGILLAIPTWNGRIFFHSKVRDRVPSSIDVDEVQEKEGILRPTLQSYQWNKESYMNLIEEAHIDYDSKGVYATFGLFLVSDEEGTKENVCFIYNDVELTFHSAFMSIHGSPSVMKIIGPCETSKDHPHEINSFFIPLKELSTIPTQNGKLKLEESPFLKFSFHNVGFDWPKAWYLHSIRFYKNENNSENEKQEQGEAIDDESIHEESAFIEKIDEILREKSRGRGREELKEQMREEAQEETQENNKEAENSQDLSLNQDLSQNSFPSEVSVKQEEILQIRGEPFLIELDSTEKENL